MRKKKKPLPSSKLSKNLKIIVGLIAIILIISAFLVLKTNFSIQKSPSDSGSFEAVVRQSDFKKIIEDSKIVIKAEKEWETYEDSAYGYSIQFPQGWYARPTPLGAAGNGGVAYIATFDPTLEYSEETELNLAEQGHVKMDIGQYRELKLENETLIEWIKRYNESTDIDQIIANGQYKHINGSDEQALVLDHPSTHKTRDGNSPNVTVMYMSKGNQVYYIAVFENPIPSQYHNLIDPILSSFAFSN